MTEEFKIIDGYNYSVSNLGNVRNNKKGTFKKCFKDGKGYLMVDLYKNNIREKFKIHRLIGIYFIENVNNYETIDHINRDILDNRVENLRWANRSQQGANRGKFKKNTPSNLSSQFIGVCFNKATNKWCPQITIDKKKTHLGSFKSEIEANDARQKYILDKNLQEFYN